MKTYKLKSTIVLLGLLSHSFSHAAQLGSQFPSHRYPTDKSFHLGYTFSLINTSRNFVESTTTERLDDNASIKITRHQFSPEFQPNRRLSVGARINLDTVTLQNPINDESLSKTSLGDQLFFTEFRFIDEPGMSLGFAGLFKFPLYNNPSLVELNESSDPSRTILMGDAQNDATILITSEKWIGSSFRMRANAGFTARFDGYASEVPYMLSLGVVNPKMDLDLRIRGNLSLGEGDPNSSDLEIIRAAFSKSDYAYSSNPWSLIVEPNVELWLSAKWAASFQYSYALVGTNAPAYHAFGAGFVYRWARTTTRQRRTFSDVPIWSDQEAGRFDGDPDREDLDRMRDLNDPIFE